MSKPLKCLTLWQPHATFVALGLKPCETRRHEKWGFLVGTRIGIHAGLSWDRWATAQARTQLRKAGRGLPAHVGTWLDLERLAKRHAGHLLCTVQVTAHRALTVHDSEAALFDTTPAEDGRRLWGFDLDEVRLFEPPIRVAGHQGVWGWTGGNAA